MTNFDKVTMLIATEQPGRNQDRIIMNIGGFKYEVIVNEVPEPLSLRSKEAKERSEGRQANRKRKSGRPMAIKRPKNMKRMRT